jgi:hypothetical protein
VLRVRLRRPWHFFCLFIFSAARCVLRRTVRIAGHAGLLITEMRILLMAANSDQMSYSACQIGPSVSYWFSAMPHRAAVWGFPGIERGAFLE